MAWYEHQPFRWILKNLTAKQIVNLMISLILIFFLIGSYYVYLDTLQSLKANPFYAQIFRWSVLFFGLLILLFFLLTYELRLALGLE